MIDSTIIIEKIELLFNTGKRNWQFLEKREIKKCADRILSLSANVLFPRAKIYYHILNGLYFEITNRPELALEELLLAEKLSITISDNYMHSEVLNYLGIVYSKTGANDEALKSFEKSLQKQITPFALSNLGTWHFNQGDMEEAKRFFGDATAYTANEYHYLDLPIIINNTAKVNIKERQLNVSAERVQDALLWAEKLRNFEAQSLLQLTLSFIERENGNLEIFENNLQKAYKIAKQVDFIQVMIQSANVLAQHYFEQKDFEKSYEYMENYRTSVLRNIENEVLWQAYEIEESQFFKERKDIESEDQIFLPEMAGNIYLTDSMKEILDEASAYLDHPEIPLLIEGETGTGKEVIARLIHLQSPNHGDPFVAINCATLTESMFESELCGYTAGSFTGAKSKGKKGQLETAGNGTILFDEIGELTFSLQSKLLHIVDERKFVPIGSSDAIPIKALMIFATNRKLQKEVNQQRFRQDLYYRINAAQIKIPTLRDTRSDIPALARFLLNEFSQVKRRRFIDFSEEAMLRIQNNQWLGNIRELRNAVEQIVLFQNELYVKPEHIKFLNVAEKTDSHLFVDLPEESKSLTQIRNEIIEKVLQKMDINKIKTAEYLGISKNTVYRWAKNN
jgi:transcriptional regulator with PAS, ATPase and Fis domain